MSLEETLCSLRSLNMYNRRRKCDNSWRQCFRNEQSAWNVMPRIFVSSVVSKLLFVCSHWQFGRLLRQKRKRFVFSKLMSSSLFFAYCCRLSISLSRMVLSSVDGCLRHNDRQLMSSEYLKMRDVWWIALQSSVNMVKRAGPPTVPWEHPRSIGKYGNFVPFQISLCIRPVLNS